MCTDFRGFPHHFGTISVAFSQPPENKPQKTNPNPHQNRNSNHPQNYFCTHSARFYQFYHHFIHLIANPTNLHEEKWHQHVKKWRQHVTESHPHVKK